MTDALTQLRDALQTVITTSEHALVPRALLRELLARLEVAEVVVEKADMLINKGGLRNNGHYLIVVESRDRTDPHYLLCDALSAHAKLKDATHD
jgi:hypothetical protein